jgi:protocatechuate 3,4-dioxygenase beta subunit
VILWHSRGHHDEPAPGPAEHGEQSPRSRASRVPAAPATLSGHVARKAGGPLAGAIVALAPVSASAGFEPGEHSPLIATTDAAGAWTVAQVQAGDYVVSATANGFLPETRPKLTVGAGESRAGIDLTLEPGGTTVHGTVTDVGGGPIGGARVQATDDEARQSSDEAAAFVALTDAEGHYTLSLPDSSFHLRASHDDYTSAVHGARVQGKPLAIDFVLVPGGVVRGQVVARDTGKPIAGAALSARVGRSGQELHHATNDGDGKFVLRSLRPGALAITAVAPGYASSEPASVQLGVGEQVDGVRVLLDRAPSIFGRVVDKATRQGVPGVHVGAFSFGGSGMASALDATGNDGAFEIPGVKPGSYNIFAMIENKVPEVGKPIEVKDKDVSGVMLELETGVTLSGHVEPPRVTTIQLKLAEELSITQIIKTIQTAFVRGQSDASGAFTVQHAPAGSFKLVASAADGTTGELPVTIADRDQTGLVVKLETRGSIAGRVIDTTGAPVPDVRVNARAVERDRPGSFMVSINDFGQEVVTAPDGTFRIVGLEPGKYDVGVDDIVDRFERMSKQKKDDKPQNLVELAAGEARTGVTVTVEARDGTIRGTVVDTSGKPVADAWVTIARQLPGMKVEGLDDMFTENTTPLLTSADGRFTADHLRKGTYHVVVEGPRGASHGEQRDVKTGTSVTITLASLGTLAGRTMTGATPVASYDLDCNGPAGRIDRHVEAADGAYTLEHLAPGHYSCSAEAETGTAHGEVDVPSGAAKLDLSLDAWATLTGTVVSVTSGQPIPGVTVTAWGTGANRRGMTALINGTGPTTDASGRFRIEHVTSGAGTLAVLGKSIGGQPLAHQPYQVSAGQQLDVGTIRIVPPPAGEQGTLGMATEPHDNQLEVTLVQPGGPAASAGIVVGDQISAIDGHAVSELTAATAAQLLASGMVSVGQKIALTLARGTTVTVTATSW